MIVDSKLSKVTFKKVEGYITNIEGLRKEIKEIEQLILSDDLKPVDRAFLISMGEIPMPRVKTDEDVKFVDTFLKERTMKGYEYEVPCHNHINDSSICAVYGFHMSKCPMIKEESYQCPTFDGGVPSKSLLEERVSQHLHYNYPEILSEVANYLEIGEDIPYSLIKVLKNLKSDFANRNSKDYMSVLFGKNKPKTKAARERKPFSTRERFEVLKRDEFTCTYCGRKPSDGIILHVDHVIPVSKGGTNEMSNLVTACDTCNLGKSDVSL